GGPELIELVTTPATLKDGKDTGYGFGLSIGEYRGVLHISHGGAFVGYRATTSRFPEHDLGISVLCNVGTARPTRLATRVADLYLADVLEPVPGSGEDEGTPGAESPKVEGSARDLERLAGSYWSEEDRSYRQILLRDGGLVYSRGGDNESPLQLIGQARFRMLEVPVDVVVRFEESRMIVEVEGREPTTFAAFTPVEPGPEEIAQLAGSYYSVELDHTQVLEVEAGALVARHSEEDTVLEPRLADVWNGGFLTLSFQRNEAGKVGGFLLDAGRVRNLRYERR
ncbi:MAG: hypothetical protein V3T72_15565, partial [Thermoanaerobaculia bacterium]